MSKQLTKERLKELYDTMPAEVAKVYEGEETARLMLDIGRKYGLAIDKIGRLTEETGYVVAGAAPAREFIDNLEAALDAPRDKAAAIAREINSRIFAPIRGSLKRMHGIGVNSTLLPEEADTERTADSAQRIGADKLSANPYPLSAESLSDRAYWGEVSKATHDEAASSGQRLETEKLSANSVIEENEKGTLIQIKKAEEKITKEAIEKELAAEVSKILKSAPVVPAAAAPLQILSSKLDTEFAPERSQDRRPAPSAAAPSPSAPPVASLAPASPVSIVPPLPTPRSYDSDPYRESVDDY